MNNLTLITGASSGLGKDFAFLAAQDGHDLVLTARREDLLQNLAAELTEKFKIEVHVVAHDLAQPGAGTALYEKVKGLGLHVDHLINNAGFGVQGAFEKLTLSKQLEMMDLNMRAVIELTYLFYPPCGKKITEKY
jgi:short-subunit dehydrogenase